MLADLFFIILILIGFITAIPATILIISGVIKKVRPTVTIGLFMLIVPVICFGLFFWFYLIYIPNINDKRIIEFSGQYRVDLTSSYNENKIKFSNAIYYMTLNTDMTFKLDSIPDMAFWGKGNWDPDGIDGQFEFLDSSGNLLNLASPFKEDKGRQLVFNLYQSNEVRFTQISD
jgi:hypothetical protein